jgi:hypothetical protein
MSSMTEIDLDGLDPRLRRVLESAARLQEVVPDAVLVGGSAAAMFAGHRASFDHDHAVADLTERYVAVLEACEATEGWATSLRASRPPMTIMGSLDGIEAGIRQLRRSRPLEVQDVPIGEGLTVRAPTAAEVLRVKAFLVVQRNQVRDYLDVAALADRFSLPWSAKVLSSIDEYYVDRVGEDEAVSTVLVQRLAEPAPKDVQVTRELDRYKALDPRWHRWDDVVAVTRELAYLMLQGEDGE